MSTQTKVPPDGGYGWIVTFAYALNNVVVLPLIAGFGLVFQEAFDDTGLSATQGTLVITLNHGIGMLLSFAAGPVLRRFGYRKVAVFGAIFISGGLILTSLSSNFWMFILSYSIVNSTGVASVMSAFSLAINSFFKEKRGRAIGVGMSITGLGAIYMPLLISLLIHLYGWRYAVLILGAICLHSLLAACLLRPAKWYLIDPPSLEETTPLSIENIELINGDINDASVNRNGVTIIQEIHNLPHKSTSVNSLTNDRRLEIRNSISHPDLRPKAAEVTTDPIYKWWASQEINLGSSINIFHESDLKKHQENSSKDELKPKIPLSLFDKIVNFFDLTLLTDPIFVNIMFGLSVASCVETNFSLLLPIILKDMFQYETSDIGKLMAIIGFSDTLFRFVSPFIGEWCNKSPRVMYMVSLLIIVFIRTIMLFTTTFTGMILVALAMGVTKGVRTVYMNIVIPSYVPLERLPFASGLQMFFNGIIIITIGSLLGRVRETSGSYKIPIIALNVVTLVTVVAWSAEFLYMKFKNPKTKINKELMLKT